INFFLQAEDGIRDRNVTGVQTCALPISVVLAVEHRSRDDGHRLPAAGWLPTARSHLRGRLRRRARSRILRAATRPETLLGTPAQIGRASCRDRLKTA